GASIRANADTVEEHADFAEFALHASGNRGHLGWIAEICFVETRAAASGRSDRLGRGATFHIEHIDDGDVGARSGREIGYRSPDTTRSAGDHGDLSGEKEPIKSSHNLSFWYGGFERFRVEESLD